MFLVMQEGMLLCRKIMDTPFPFPWAQAVNFVILIFCITVPFIIVAYTASVAAAVVVTFIATHTHVMLNEVRVAVLFPTFCLKVWTSSKIT
jgi:predicted membrane chloride channel (bestrophin family)